MCGRRHASGEIHSRSAESVSRGVREGDLSTIYAHSWTTFLHLVGTDGTDDGVPNEVCFGRVLCCRRSVGCAVPRFGCQ